VTALILGALIAVAAVVVVSLPFLRESSEPELIDSGRETEELLGLLEARDRSLAALKEIEFDHRTGKVDDVDYRALVGPLRRQAAEALQALDARTGRSDGLTDQEHVQGDDNGRDRGRRRRRDASVDERPHHVTAGREPDERDEGERDAEGKNDL
jgi:hypothetical protein